MGGQYNQRSRLAQREGEIGTRVKASAIPAGDEIVKSVEYHPRQWVDRSIPAYEDGRLFRVVFLFSLSPLLPHPLPSRREGRG